MLAGPSLVRPAGPYAFNAAIYQQAILVSEYLMKENTWRTPMTEIEAKALFEARPSLAACGTHYAQKPHIITDVGFFIWFVFSNNRFKPGEQQ